MSLSDIAQTLTHELSAALAERGMVTIAVRPRDRSIDDPRRVIDCLVESLGFRGLGRNWRPVDRQESLEILTAALAFNLAYCRACELDEEDADKFARRFLDAFSDESQFFTNMPRWQSHKQISATGEESEYQTRSGGHQVAPATFEEGVACASSDLVGVLWVQDED